MNIGLGSANRTCTYIQFGLSTATTPSQWSSALPRLFYGGARRHLVAAVAFQSSKKKRTSTLADAAIVKKSQ
jgi:hypothetical protein